MRCATIEKRLPLSSITSLAARYMLGRGEYGITYLCAQAAMGAWMVYKSISKWKLWTLMDVGGMCWEVEMGHMPRHPKHIQPEHLWGR